MQMNLNVRLNFGVIWYYTLPSKFRGILFTLQLEIQKSTAILEKKKLTEIEAEYWRTDLHAKII